MISNLVIIVYLANFHSALVNHLSMYLNTVLDEIRKEASNIKQKEWKADNWIEACLNATNNWKHIQEDEIC